MDHQDVDRPDVDRPDVGHQYVLQCQLPLGYVECVRSARCALDDLRVLDGLRVVPFPAFLRMGCYLDVDRLDVHQLLEQILGVHLGVVHLGVGHLLSWRRLNVACPVSLQMGCCLGEVHLHVMLAWQQALEHLA